MPRKRFTSYRGGRAEIPTVANVTNNLSNALKDSGELVKKSATKIATPIAKAVVSATKTFENNLEKPVSAIVEKGSIGLNAVRKATVDPSIKQIEKALNAAKTSPDSTEPKPKSKTPKPKTPNSKTPKSKTPKAAESASKGGRRRYSRRMGVGNNMVNNAKYETNRLNNEARHLFSTVVDRVTSGGAASRRRRRRSSKKKSRRGRRVSRRRFRITKGRRTKGRRGRR